MKKLDAFTDEACAQEQSGSDAFGKELVGRLLTLEEICLVGGGGGYCMGGGTTYQQTGGSYTQGGQGSYTQSGGSYNMNCM